MLGKARDKFKDATPFSEGLKFSKPMINEEKKRNTALTNKVDRA